MILGDARFVPYGGQLYHCTRCHGLVNAMDASDERDERAILEAHAALFCVGTNLLRGDWL